MKRQNTDAMLLEAQLWLDRGVSLQVRIEDLLAQSSVITREADRLTAQYREMIARAKALTAKAVSNNGASDE